MAFEVRRGAAGREASNSLGVSSWRFRANAVENRFDVTFGTDTGTNVAVHKSNRFKDRYKGQESKAKKIISKLTIGSKFF